MNSFEKDGFKIIKNVLNHKELTSLKEYIKYVFYITQFKRLNIQEPSFEWSLIKLFKTDLEAFKNTGKIIQNLPGVFQLLTCPAIDKELHEVGLNNYAITTKPVLFFHNKNLALEEIYYKTPPHQDFYSIRSSLDGVVVWFSLCDVDEKLGPLKVIPGSHLKGSQWTEDRHSFGVCGKVNEKDFISLPVETGDMIIFNQMLVHASGDNQYEDRIRWSVNFRYGNLESRYWQDHKLESPYEYKSHPKSFEGPTEKEMKEFFNVN